jgi:hypothetical protein
MSDEIKNRGQDVVLMSHEDVKQALDEFIKESQQNGHQHLVDFAQDLKKDAKEIATGMISVGDAVDIQRGEITSPDGQIDHKPYLSRALDRIQGAAKSLAVNLGETGKQVRTLAKEKLPGAEKITRAWGDVLDAAAHYTTVGMKRLAGLAQGLDKDDQYKIGFASGHLQSAHDVVIEQRRRGLLQALKDPQIGEDVLHHAKAVGIVQTPSKPVHRGSIVNLVGLEAVVKTAKGQILAVPVTPDFKFKAGDNVVLRERGDGFYNGKRQLLDKGIER